VSAGGVPCMVVIGSIAPAHDFRRGHRSSHRGVVVAVHAQGLLKISTLAIQRAGVIAPRGVCCRFWDRF
jgi:hypothetical protein